MKSITSTFAAAQIWSAKSRIARKLLSQPEKRQDHFKKYNIGSSTYDEAYTRAFGEEYLGYMEQTVHKAAERGADLLLFSEFCFVPGVVAEPMEGINRNPNAVADAVKLYTWSGRLFIDWMRHFSKKTGMLIAGATYTIREGRIYNTGLVSDEKGKIALRYEKIHLPYDEKMLVAAGDKYTVASTRVGRIGFSICYDMQYLEQHAILVERGAQIILHPSGGYTLPGESRDMGQNRLRVRASDTFCALVYAASGPEHEWDPNESCVIAPNGDVVACVRGMKTGLAVGKVTITEKRPYGSDPNALDWEGIRRSLRRPDTYGPLLRKIALKHPA